MYVLGIDTGGTYTDAVLFDRSNDKVIAKAKALTARDDLGRGIINAVKALDLRNPEKILLVSLSTTLATNSIVEGKGGREALILIGYDEDIVRNYGSKAGLVNEDYYIIKGRHDLNGNEIEPLDHDELKRVIEATNGVDAYAVSSYLGVRNPDHELAARDIIIKETGLPVACGTDLSGELDSLKRAATAALNAKLIPFIKELIESLRVSLRQLGIDSPLAVVKGDGSLMDWMTAIEKPVETILSGPAASCIGAHHISSAENAIMIDVGGTTTDIAIITDGRPKIDPKGAEVGSWKTAVKAIDMTTVGIGGDSRIGFDRVNMISVGR